jgi:hypothetical protein
MKKLLAIVIGIAGTAMAAVWVGLRIKPRPFPGYPDRTPDLETADLPADMPPPVARFFRTIISDRIPVIRSAVLTGRAQLRLFGLYFPARFRITHEAGQGYRHYFELTLFGIPLMKVDECYLDSRARLELPFGVVENQPKVDMAANLGLWAESIWLPSILVTDPRLRWELVDATTARLVVPFADTDDTFTVTFDPETGLVRRLEAMRYKEAESGEKVLWRNEILGWRAFHGIRIPSPATVTWLDEGKPWSIWTVEDVVYNADVSAYIRSRGL